MTCLPRGGPLQTRHPPRPAAVPCRAHWGARMKRPRTRGRHRQSQVPPAPRDLLHRRPRGVAPDPREEADPDQAVDGLPEGHPQPVEPRAYETLGGDLVPDVHAVVHPLSAIQPRAIRCLPLGSAPASRRCACYCCCGRCGRCCCCCARCCPRVQLPSQRQWLWTSGLSHGRGGPDSCNPILLPIREKAVPWHRRQRGCGSRARLRRPRARPDSIVCSDSRCCTPLGRRGLGVQNPLRAPPASQDQLHRRRPKLLSPWLGARRCLPSSSRRWWLAPSRRPSVPRACSAPSRVSWAFSTGGTKLAHFAPSPPLSRPAVRRIRGRDRRRPLHDRHELLVHRHEVAVKPPRIPPLR